MATMFPIIIFVLLLIFILLIRLFVFFAKAARVTSSILHQTCIFFSPTVSISTQVLMLFLW